MVRFYDNWERLVVAVMRREQLRQLSLEESRSPSIRSYDSDFSFSCSSSSRYNDDDAFYKESVSSLHPDAVKLRLAQSAKELGKQSGGIGRKTRKVIRKGISIFSVFSFKKDNGRGEREFQWAKSQRTFHGNAPSSSSKQSNEEVSVMAEQAKRTAEIARLRELYTLKGHIESVMKVKGLDIDSIQHYYTV